MANRGGGGSTVEQFYREYDESAEMWYVTRGLSNPRRRFGKNDITYVHGYYVVVRVRSIFEYGRLQRRGGVLAHYYLTLAYRILEYNTNYLVKSVSLPIAPCSILRTT